MSSSTKLKIGFISPMHYPAHPPFKGGAEATSWYTTELLARYGHEVYLFQRGSYGPDNVTNIQFDAPSMFDQEPLLAGAILRFADAQKLDVLINTSWIDVLPAMNISGYGPPMLNWLTIPAWTFPNFPHNLKRYQGWGISRFKTFAQTFTQAEGYKELGIRLHGEHLSVPLGPYVYRNEATDKPGDYFVWAGRPVTEKGPDRAIQLAIQTDTPIYMFCSSETPLLAELIERYKHNEYVHFIFGASPEEIVVSMYSARATIFLNRNNTAEGKDWQEPGSRVIMESLLQGCPVIGTRNGCLRHWVESGTDGILVDEQSETFQIVPELKNFERLDRMRIQERALADWSEEAIYRRIMDATTQTLS